MAIGLGQATGALALPVTDRRVCWVAGTDMARFSGACGDDSPTEVYASLRIS